MTRQTTGQMDLLALLQPDRESERAAWAARFERKPWVAPYDTGGGLRKGQSVLGWVCPACGVLEVNEYVLRLNHGYDPSIPGRMAGVIESFGQWCTRQMLLASQERARAQRDARNPSA